MAGRTRETGLAARMIPLARPLFGDEEKHAAGEAIAAGWVTQGPKVKAFEDDFAAYVGSRYACAVSSCTTGLHAALLTVGVKPGNTVITVSHSFVATANSIRLCGAEPVFVDIDPATYNLSPVALDICLKRECQQHNGRLFYKNIPQITAGDGPLKLLKESGEYARVAAIIVVHQMGMPADMRQILDLAKAHQLPVIEDAACAAGSEVNVGGSWERVGRPHGEMAVFSFHPRKVLVTGEGGMITTDNVDFDRQLRLIRHQGMSISDTERHSSHRVLVEEYPVMGFNYRMSDIQAAIGIEQLKKMPVMVDRRRQIALLYEKGLASVKWIKTPEEPAYARTNRQSFPVRLLEGSPMGQNDFMQYLLESGIASRPGIVNAHEQGPYRSARWSLRHSEMARRSVVLLPIYCGMGDEDVQYIIEVIKHA